MPSTEGRVGVTVQTRAQLATGEAGHPRPAPTRAPVRMPHATSLLVAATVLGAAVGLGLTLRASSDDAVRRALNAQVHQVGASLQAAVPAIQEPLIAASHLATTGGVGSFKEFVGSEVGAGAPFRSVTLWSVREGQLPRELAAIGPQPELLSRPGAGPRELAAVGPSTELTVLGLFTRPSRVLGVAERLPGPHSSLLVYAENPVPATSPGSPLDGLDFALFYGRSTSRAALMTSTIPLPPRGSSARATVRFASGVLTVVVALAARPAGALPGPLPWAVIALGAVVALFAAVGVERLVRRREAAEAEATLRTRDYETEREISQTLQDALRPTAPTALPGLELATRYVAGVEHLNVGGDWFDVIEVDETRLFVTVGDVSGRGLRAATVMGSLRPAIRAYAVQGDAPHEVLRKLNDLVDVVRDECFATVLCAVFDVGQRRVTLANAGHPPPLLVDRNGARFLTSQVGPPVGVPSANAARAITVDLARGASMLFYTDGLVERRGRTIDAGLEQLRSAAVGATGSLDDVVAGLLASLVPDGGDDDVAVLGLRWS